MDEQRARTQVSSRAAPGERPGSIRQGRTFDLMASFHVIDHLPDPPGFLRSAAAALRPGGFVLLVAHDAGAPLARLLGSFNPIFDVEHICLFSRATVRTLFERAGLEVLEVGPLANTYPLGSWLRLAPGLSRLAGLLPAQQAQHDSILRAAGGFWFEKPPG